MQALKWVARLFRRAIWVGIRLGVAVVVLMTVLMVLAIGSLRWLNPPTSSLILQHRMEVASNPDVAISQGDWINWSDIAPVVPLAIIAAEDQRFPDHNGIDFTELKKALLDPAQTRRGASTLTQQLAKNLFLWKKRSYFRKGAEALVALTMEVLLDKQRILEIYMNVAQFGPTHYGIGAITEQFFNRSPSSINRKQAAMLAAVLPNPAVYSATNPGSRVKKRQKWILRQMRQLGGIRFLKQLDKSGPEGIATEDTAL